MEKKAIGESAKENLIGFVGLNIYLTRIGEYMEMVVIYIGKEDKNMKTSKNPGFAVCTSASIAKSQAQTVGPVIKGGLNYGSLPSGLNALSDEAGKMGFPVGAFARVGDNLYFHPEVNCSTYSSKHTYDTQKFQSKFGNPTVPLMAGYKLVNRENLKFRLPLGPDLSYFLKGGRVLQTF